MENIYVLEDDDNTRKLVCYALAKEGYYVKGFPFPSEFYTAYQAFRRLIRTVFLKDSTGLTRHVQRLSEARVWDLRLSGTVQCITTQKSV